MNIRSLRLLAPLSVILGIFFFITPIAAAASSNAQTIAVPIVTNGTRTEQALLSLPSSYNSTSQTYPLLVFLHGSGEAGSDLSKIYTSQNAGGPAYYISQGTFPASFINPADGKQYQFIVLSPQASSWSTSASSLDAIIRYMVSNYRVDSSRIYLTGLSAGGQGIKEYTVSDLDGSGNDNTPPAYLPAAIVPMSMATGRPTQLDDSTTIAEQVHVWGFGSPSDIYGIMTHLYVDGEYNGNNCGGCTGLGTYGRMTDYVGGHSGWGNFYNPNYTETINGQTMNIYQWMLQYSRGTSSGGSTHIAPTVSVGQNQSITLPTSSVSISGNATAQAGATISRYTWTETSGPATASINSPNAASTVVSNLSTAGTYIFRLTATDSNNLSSSGSVTVTVNAAAVQTPPTVSAGSNQSITLPTNSVILSGSASAASGSTLTTIAWTQSSGPNTATIASPSSLTTTVSNLIQGTYTFTLAVSASNGKTTSSNVSISVGAAPSSDNTAQIDPVLHYTFDTASLNFTTNVMTDAAGTANAQMVNINSSNSITGALGQGLNFTGSQYAVVGQPSNLHIAPSDSYTVTAWINLPVAGESGAIAGRALSATTNREMEFYTYQGTLQSDIGGVSNGNSTPLPLNKWTLVAVVNNPTQKSNTLYVNGTAISTYQDGTATNPGIDLLIGGRRNSSNSDAAYAMVGGLDDVRIYNRQLSVSDLTALYQEGASSANTSTQTGTNESPIVSVSSAQTITLPSNSITLFGNATDADGWIANTGWSQVSGPSTATLTTQIAASSNVSISNLTQGTYVFKFTAVDNQNAVSNANVTVTVNAAPAKSTTTYTSNSTTHVITGSGNFSITPSTISGLECGDTIAISGGPYLSITVSGVSGCAGNPITITNSGAPITITQYGLALEDDHHIVVKSSTTNGYGFIITGGSGTAIGESSSDIDVSGTDAEGSGYGFVVKTDPSCSVLNYVAPALISNIRIHNNLIQNTVYEGMYLGYYNPGTVTLNCDGQTYNVQAERLSQVSVYDNILRNTGNDSIKLRLCHNGCDVYNNSISGYGVIRTNDTSWCFGITIGSETYGSIYGNSIDHGYCSAIDIRTDDSTHPFQIYNNSISYAGTLPNGSLGATWASGIGFDVLSANQSFSIHNNTSSNENGADVEVDDYTPVAFSGSICSSGSYIIWPKGMGPALCNGSPFVWVGTVNTQVVHLPTTTAKIYGFAVPSTDTGTITSYKWTQTSGPNTASNSSATTGTANLSNLILGTYRFALKAIDSTGSSGLGYATIIVTSSSTLPTAGSPSSGGSTNPPPSTGNSGGSTGSSGSTTPPPSSGSSSTNPPPATSGGGGGGGSVIPPSTTPSSPSSASSGGSTNPPSSSSVTHAVSVTTPVLNVRSTPGGKVVGHVTPNDMGTLLWQSSATPWVEVTFSNGLTGFVSNQYVSITGTPASTSSTTGSSAERITITTNSLRVRSAPINGTVLGHVNTGDEGTVLSTSSDGSWLKVQFSSFSGYVYKQYTAPVTETPTTPSSSTTSTTTQTLDITTPVLNVRTSPGGSVIGHVTPNDTGTLLSQSPTSLWIEASFTNGLTGYVDSEYTSLSTPSTNSVTVATATLHVRKTPNGTIIGKVHLGQQGTLISSTNGWSDVSFSTLTGYVSDAYITK